MFAMSLFIASYVFVLAVQSGSSNGYCRCLESVSRSAERVLRRESLTLNPMYPYISLLAHHQFARVPLGAPVEGSVEEPSGKHDVLGLAKEFVSWRFVHPEFRNRTLNWRSQSYSTSCHLHWSLEMPLLIQRTPPLMPLPPGWSRSRQRVSSTPPPRRSSTPPRHPLRLQSRHLELRQKLLLRSQFPLPSQSQSSKKSSSPPRITTRDRRKGTRPARQGGRGHQRQQR